MEFKYCIENEDFDIGKILESGQNLSFKKNGNIYSFMINNEEIFSYTENNKTYFSIDEEYFNNHLYNFFELNVDYSYIRSQINEKFPELISYVEYGKGIRFISQDLLEVAIVFIFSQNNNINRILKSAQLLKERYGNNSFPTLDKLKELSQDDFRNLGIGFRDKYVYNFVQAIDEDWIYQIKKMDTKEAFLELISFLGIGPKVANCILLFGLNKRDVFPVDTHIKKIMQKLYFSDKDIDTLEIEKFALKKYGDLSSYVQQYLFYWQIMHKN